MIFHALSIEIKNKVTVINSQVAFINYSNTSN